MNDLAQKYVRMCVESEFDHEFDQQLANLRAVLTAGASLNFTMSAHLAATPRSAVDIMLGLRQDTPHPPYSPLEYVAHLCPVLMRGLFVAERPAYENLLLLMRVLFDAGARVQPQCLAHIPTNARAHREIFKLLLAAGAEIDAVGQLHRSYTRKTFTFLSAAVFCGRVDLVELALELGADASDTYYPLMWVLEKLDDNSLMSGVTFNIARALLVYGANPSKNRHLVANSNGKIRLQVVQQPFIPMWRKYSRRRTEHYTCNTHEDYLADLVALVIAARAGNEKYTYPRAKDVPELAERVARHTKELAQRRFAVVHARALEICATLHPLGLSAHETVAILDHTIKLMPMVLLHMKWALVTTVKHFHQRAEEEKLALSSVMQADGDDAAVAQTKMAKIE